jgi:hypothetical protein
MMEHTIRELGLSVVPPFGDDEQLSVEDLDDLPMHPIEYQHRWLQWEGREEEFYIRSFEIVRQIQLQDFNLILAPEYPEQLKTLEEKYHRMVTIPDILHVNQEYYFEEVIQGTYRIRMSSILDRNENAITHAFDVPKSVIDSFREGKKTDFVLEKLSTERGIQLGKDLIIALFRHGILTDGQNV